MLIHKPAYINLLSTTLYYKNTQNKKEANHTRDSPPVFLISDPRAEGQGSENLKKLPQNEQAARKVDARKAKVRPAGEEQPVVTGHEAERAGRPLPLQSHHIQAWGVKIPGHDIWIGNHCSCGIKSTGEQKNLRKCAHLLALGVNRKTLKRVWKINPQQM